MASTPLRLLFCADLFGWRPAVQCLGGQLVSSLGRHAVGLYRPTDDRAGVVAFLTWLFRDDGLSENRIPLRRAAASDNQCFFMGRIINEPVARSVLGDASLRKKRVRTFMVRHCDHQLLRLNGGDVRTCKGITEHRRSDYSIAVSIPRRCRRNPHVYEHDLCVQPRRFLL